MKRKKGEPSQATDDRSGGHTSVEDFLENSEAAVGRDGFAEGLQDLLNRAVRLGMDSASGVDPQMRELMQSLKDKLELLVEQQASAGTVAVPQGDASTDSTESRNLLAKIEGRLDHICESVVELRNAPDRVAQEPEVVPLWAQAISKCLENLVARQERQAAESQEAAIVAAEAVPDVPVQQEDKVCQSQLEKAVFGKELADDSDIADQRRQLLEQVLQGESAACNFAGVLLTFQAGNADRKKRTLSEVGKAFYQWRPQAGVHGHDTFEKSLQGAMNTISGDLGLELRVQTVHVGDRFEKNLHSADGRGGREVTQVKGWIVAREDGRAFDKASVDVL